MVKNVKGNNNLPLPIRAAFAMAGAVMLGACAVGPGSREEAAARATPVVDAMVTAAVSGACVDAQPEAQLRKALSTMNVADLETLADKNVVVCISPLQGQYVTFGSIKLKGIYSPSSNGGVVSINYGDGHYTFKTYLTLQKLAGALRSGKGGTLVTFGINQDSLGPGGNIWMTLGEWGKYQTDMNRNFINRYTKGM